MGVELEWAITNKDFSAFKAAWGKSSEEERVAVLADNIIYGFFPVLHLALDEGLDVLERLMQSLPVENQFAALRLGDHKTDLCAKILSYPNGLAFLKNMFTNQKPDRVMTPLYRVKESYSSTSFFRTANDTSPGRTWLHYAARISAPWLEFLLNLIPENTTKRAAIQTKDEFGGTVLHSAANNPESLAILLPVFQKSDDTRVSALIVFNNFSNSTVMLAASNADSIKVILDNLGRGKPRSLLKLTDYPGPAVPTIQRNALHAAAPHGAVVNLLLPSLTANDLVHRDSEFCTPLHLAARDTESLSMLLGLYKTVEEKITAIEKNSHHGRVLDFAIATPSSIKLVLELYKPNERLAKLQQLYPLLISDAVRYPHSLEAILLTLPVNDRSKALDLPSSCNTLPIDNAISHPQSLEIFIRYSKPEEHFARLLHKNIYNQSTWQHMVGCSTPFIMESVLKPLTESQHFFLIHINAENGNPDDRLCDRMSYMKLKLDKSFLPTYLEIRDCINTNENLIELKKTLNTCDSFDACKGAILAFLTEHKSEPYIQPLLKACGFNNLDTLSEQWENTAPMRMTC